tara:strand:+ start:91 stop:573 length:483 start_codon:yes stop_codon:yes gene_type:complete
MKKKKLYPGLFLIEKKFDKDQIYYYLKTPNISIIIAEFKKKFLVVSQKRIPINKIIYEFPGGIIDKNSSPIKSAKTELFEETGYKCVGNPIKLGNIYPDAGRLNCEYFCYYTKNIKKINKPEAGIKLHFLSKSQIFKLINQKKFSHACHIFALFKYLNKK